MVGIINDNSWTQTNYNRDIGYSAVQSTEGIISEPNISSAESPCAASAGFVSTKYKEKPISAQAVRMRYLSDEEMINLK